MNTARKYTQKQQIAILILVLGFGFVTVGILLSFLTTNNTAANNANAGTSKCTKAGINTANSPIIDVANYQRAKSLGMGYTLEIVNDTSTKADLISSFQNAIGKGLKPILRVCTSANISQCEFKDPQVYANYLNDVATALDGKQFFAIAGPNEPASEPWTGGTEGDASSIAPSLATYMNSVISNINKSNIILLSPTINISNPVEKQIVNLMKENGANFNDLGGISFNAYNMDSGKVSFWVDQMKQLASTNDFADKNLYLLETGMYEIKTGVSHDQAVQNLKEEVSKLKDESAIKAFLFFNSFGTNSDPNFQYNVLTDAEFQDILGSECMYSETPTPVVTTPGTTTTPTRSPTLTPSTTPSVTPSVTPSLTPSVTVTATATATVQYTASPLPTTTPDPSVQTLPKTDLDSRSTLIIVVGLVFLIVGLNIKKKYN